MNRTNEDSPATPPVGSWRSVFVEDIQLKRKLQLGFEKVSDGKREGTLIACGPDASLPISPDGKLQIIFSELEFRPVGVHHMMTAFQAFQRQPEQPVHARFSVSSPVLHAVAGVAIGTLVTTAIFWISLRSRR